MILGMQISHVMALVLGGLACVCDLRTRRIPNVLTFGGAAVALGYALASRGFGGLLTSLEGWGVGLALFLPMFLLGGMGAGDVKLLACLGAWVLIARTALGFAGRVTGGNLRAAQLQGLPVQRLMIGACLLGGGCAGLAGTIEVAAVHGRANASLAVGYGYSGILVAFLARHHPIAIIPVAILLGGIGASGGLLQRRLDLPDAAVVVLQGIIFVAILASETLYGRLWKPKAAA